ncbi:hypothetical protein CCAX7_29590 [Capsulimonas corticalis]|uniref:Uncharacterized protein n=1 Tax=Capsulimonas corticalis TaxID=2219043 RepID=A0A402CSZ1_9BACT|nr:hypothetical protein [Capsulimonas corticalis]BDI30908.1 hypothetical protein CCAX7_29590 [Capsulimonas corticalis]
MIRARFAAALVLVLCGTGSAHAASHAKRATGKAIPLQSSRAQVDGIVSSVVDDLWAQNDEYWHHGDYPRIIALDRVIVGADPHFLECYATGGWLMESMGALGDAEAFYQMGVRTNPDQSYAYFNLGEFYFNTLKDYKAAALVLRAGVRHKGYDINDWKTLAHAYERAGDIDNSVKTWKTIKAHWPNGVAVDHNLTRIVQIQKSGAGAAGRVSLPGPPPLP